MSQTYRSLVNLIPAADKWTKTTCNEELSYSNQLGEVAVSTNFIFSQALLDVEMYG